MGSWGTAGRQERRRAGLTPQIPPASTLTPTVLNRLRFGPEHHPPAVADRTSLREKERGRLRCVEPSPRVGLSTCSARFQRQASGTGFDLIDHTSFSTMSRSDIASAKRRLGIASTVIPTRAYRYVPDHDAWGPCRRRVYLPVAVRSDRER